MIIESCKRLQNLDVTSCRDIPIVDRRRIFEEGYHLTKASFLADVFNRYGRNLEDNATP